MNRSVLIVDDDEDIRTVLAEFLDMEGYAVATAGNGREALARLRQQAHPAVVLLDLMMPIMDGFAFREEQKSDPALAAIPVVVMTARGVLEPGAIDVEHVIPKPLDLDRLLGALDDAAAGGALT